jgi:hypothetical protein
MSDDGSRIILMIDAELNASLDKLIPIIYEIECYHYWIPFCMRGELVFRFKKY